MTNGSEQQTTATVPANAEAGRALKLLGAVVVLVGLPLLVQWAFDFTTDRDANRFAIVGVAIVLGVLGVFALFWVMDQIVDRLPRGWRETARPYVFVGPALVVLSVFPIIPVVTTLLLSFKDRRGAHRVGLDNFVLLFTAHSITPARPTTPQWLCFCPPIA